MSHRREDYAGTGPLPWLDRPGARAEIDAREARGELTAAQADLCRHFERDGYVKFEGVLDAAECAQVNQDIDAIVSECRHLPRMEAKLRFQDVYRHSDAVRRMFRHPFVFERMDLLLGTPVLPYQTLNLPISSQQAPHSDEILMTTSPAGYLIAAWFALEDIPADSGPLIVFPGSHRLPYVSARETGIPRAADEAECGRVFDANYYGLIAQRLETAGLEPLEYTPRQGDVLFWHSGLIHGARPIERGDATRRSMIAHYFGAGALPYSDLFGRGCPLPGLRELGTVTLPGA